MSKWPPGYSISSPRGARSADLARRPGGRDDVVAHHLDEQRRRDPLRLRAGAGSRAGVSVAAREEAVRPLVAGREQRQVAGLGVGAVHRRESCPAGRRPAIRRGAVAEQRADRVRGSPALDRRTLSASPADAQHRDAVGERRLRDHRREPLALRGDLDHVPAGERGAPERDPVAVDAVEPAGVGDRRPPVVVLAADVDQQPRLAAGVAEVAVVEDERRVARRRRSARRRRRAAPP